MFTSKNLSDQHRYEQLDTCLIGYKEGKVTLSQDLTLNVYLDYIKLKPVIKKISTKKDDIFD